MKYLLLLSVMVSSTGWTQSQNTFPTDNNVIINRGNLLQSGGYNLETQGAIKLKNFLLFDSDGDFTGNNYYTIQDNPSGDYLRFGYKFQDDFIINSLGNVGLGTANPVGDGLTVVGGDVGKDILTLDRPGIGKFRFNAGGYHTRLTINSGNSDRFSIGYDNTKGGLAFTRDIDFTSSNHTLFVKNDGNIGIGTSNPSYTLDVNGAVRLGDNDASGLLISKFTSALTDIPGSISGIRINGPQSAHVVLDINANDGNDGFYVRVPETIEPNATANKLAFVVKANGRVGIGINPTEKLSVDGTILSEEVRVEVVDPPDFVFAPNYNLMPLAETEAYIKANHHLPEVPSAVEMQEEGLELGKMNMLLLQKIEELTLHQIEQHKKIELLQKQTEYLIDVIIKSQLKDN